MTHQTEITINSELPETVEETVTEKIEENNQEIGEVISEAIEENNETIAEEIAENNEQLEEKVKSWLEQALSPITEILATIPAMLSNLSEMNKKVATIQEQLTPPALPEISSGMQTETPLSVPTESLESVADESPAQVEQALQEPLKAAREIIRL